MGKNQTLLIVEDDTTNYLYLKEVFDEYFNIILHARNGVEAVNFFTENSDISLILMDLKMPVMDGFEATRQIKKISPNVPIIAQTAYAFNEDKIKALEAGCDDYIAKPIELQTLLDLIVKYQK
ncbi:MAG: response regulator [Bacteroidales bacterium]|jgi:CheY-like chemotaxis protein|nr:response regulator [Bacteroidales bacterium]